MEQNIVIYIGIWNTLGLFATVVLGAWYAAYRLGKIETKVGTLETSVSTLGGRVDHLYDGQSPVALLPKGIKILEESGLKKWIDGNCGDLLEKCKSAHAMGNPYDIQTAAFTFFDKIDFPAEMEEKLKTAAFQNGVGMDNVRRIGGIYFRDVCLKDAGFEPTDLDKSSA
jgi:hypothetical protein